jgi:hypothetical protein
VLPVAAAVVSSVHSARERTAAVAVLVASCLVLLCVQQWHRLFSVMQVHVRVQIACNVSVSVSMLSVCEQPTWHTSAVIPTLLLHSKNKHPATPQNTSNSYLSQYSGRATS